jgi:spermidine synthase
MIKKFLGKKWFFENFIASEFQGSTWGFAIGKEIYSGKSKFQKIEIFEAKEFGKILALDGLVQLSTKHEYIYHEMLVHPAFLYHQKPEKVLIIGGGDGGVLREVVKYKTIREIFLVDIDKKVIEVSKKYLPSVSQGGFSDKRLKIFNEDALNFTKKYKNYFDVIINDLTDPIGPSFRLWQMKFYKDILGALKENGIAAFQTGYLKEKFAKKARENLRKVFPFFKMHKAFVGCFPFDEHTFSFGSKKINFNKVNFGTVSKRFKNLNIKTKYYTPQIHFTSAVLPEIF